MISEAKLKHKLWNFLESRDYRVGGEIRVVPNEKIEELRKRRLEEYPLLEALGSYAPKSWKRISYVIDLVSAHKNEFIGYEVKSKFEGLSSGYFWHQMKCYAEGNMLDRIYLVFHGEKCTHDKYEKEYEHVLASYEHVLDEEGIGLMILYENGEFVVQKKARKLDRTFTPDLKKNEAWLRQKTWNYFESRGFTVEGEVKLENIAKRAKKRIDLTFFQKGKIYQPSYVNRTSLTT